VGIYRFQAAADRVKFLAPPDIPILSAVPRPQDGLSFPAILALCTIARKPKAALSRLGKVLGKVFDPHTSGSPTYIYFL
jgi:hypothetical protein